MKRKITNLGRRKREGTLLSHLKSEKKKKNWYGLFLYVTIYFPPKILGDNYKII